MRPRALIAASILATAALSIDATAQTPDRLPPDAPISQVINQGIDALSRRVLPTLGAVAAVGVLTMAVQQALKELLRYHRRFNSSRVEEWARERKDEGGNALGGLVTLATAGQHGAIADAQALCDLDGPGLTAQLTLAAKLALMFPEQAHHERVLRMVTGDIGATDVATLLGKTGGIPTAVDDARTRLGFLIDRSMDTLQVRLTYEWARVNQMIAFVLSAAIAAVAGGFYYWNQGILARSASEQAMHFTMIFAGAILSGVLAPVAKDLVTALQSLKGR